MTQAIGSGKIAAGTFVATSAIDLKAQGRADRVQATQGPEDEGHLERPWHGMFLRKAPHPNAARLMFDFMVTRKGQALMQQHLGTVLRGVPDGFYATSREQNLKDSTPEKVSEFQHYCESLVRK
jgi:iron(III) transport system substrate-binding protein